MNEFIATCPFEGAGARAEAIVWEKLKEALKDEEVLVYYQYPLFGSNEECKRQPDILLFHRQWGIMIIEVKGIQIEQIQKVRGGQWEVKDYFDKPYINPGKQAEKQLEALMKKFTDRKLVGKIPVKIAIAVPYIEKKQWIGKGLVLDDQPLLFKDEMGPKTLKEWLRNVPLLYGHGTLTDAEWELMLNKVGGIQVKDEDEAYIAEEGSKAFIRTQVESEIHKLDIQQERIAKVIPPGPQRIRGIAGSGKTILLCQRAAHMHLKYPDLKIAIVFQTKSLYNSMTRYVKRYIENFTEGDKT